MIVSAHAIARYQERVRLCTDDEARAALANDRIRRIVAFGAKYFRLGTGHRVVIEGETIATVLPLEARPKMHRLQRTNGND